MCDFTVFLAPQTLQGNSQSFEDKTLEGSTRKQHLVVGEGLHFQRIAARIAEEHRRLFAGLPLEADGRRYREFGTRGLEPVGQRPVSYTHLTLPTKA